MLHLFGFFNELYYDAQIHVHHAIIICGTSVNFLSNSVAICSYRRVI